MRRPTNTQTLDIEYARPSGERDRETDRTKKAKLKRREREERERGEGSIQTTLGASASALRGDEVSTERAQRTDKADKQTDTSDRMRAR